MLHWNGSKWSRVTSPSVLTGPGQLAAITVVSAKDAWAVGYTGTFTTTASTRTLLLHWNGAAWSQVTSPAPVAGALSGVTATASRGWAVGYVPNGHNFPNSLALRLSGATWSRVSISGGIELVGVAVTGTSAAWALGYNEQGSELERWNGSKWTFEPSILPDDLYLMPAIAAGPGGTAFTVGVKQSLSSASPVPVALRLTGSSWHSVTVHAPSNGQLNAVTFAPGGGAWTAGSTGKSTLVLRWTGAAWVRVASPNPGGSNEISRARVRGRGQRVGGRHQRRQDADPALEREGLELGGRTAESGHGRASVGCDLVAKDFATRSQHVAKDDVRDPGDGNGGDHFERGRGAQQRLHRLLVHERLGELGGILSVGGSVRVASRSARIAGGALSSTMWSKRG